MGGAIHERIQNSHTQIESAKFFPRRLSRETRCRVLEEGRKEGSQRIENRESRRGKKNRHIIQYCENRTSHHIKRRMHIHPTSTHQSISQRDRADTTIVTMNFGHESTFETIGVVYPADLKLIHTSVYTYMLERYRSRCCYHSHVIHT